MPEKCPKMPCENKGGSFLRLQCIISFGFLLYQSSLVFKVLRTHCAYGVSINE